jgi:hypothetical protein
VHLAFRTAWVPSKLLCRFPCRCQHCTLKSRPPAHTQPGGEKARLIQCLLPLLLPLPLSLQPPTTSRSRLGGLVGECGEPGAAGELLLSLPLCLPLLPCLDLPLPQPLL